MNCFDFQSLKQANNSNYYSDSAYMEGMTEKHEETMFMVEKLGQNSFHRCTLNKINEQNGNYQNENVKNVYNEFEPFKLSNRPANVINTRKKVFQNNVQKINNYYTKQIQQRGINLIDNNNSYRGYEEKRNFIGNNQERNVRGIQIQLTPDKLPLSQQNTNIVEVQPKIIQENYLHKLNSNEPFKQQNPQSQHFIWDTDTFGHMSSCEQQRNQLTFGHQTSVDSISSTNPKKIMMMLVNSMNDSSTMNNKNVNSNNNSQYIETITKKNFNKNALTLNHFQSAVANSSFVTSPSENLVTSIFNGKKEYSLQQIQQSSGQIRVIPMFPFQNSHNNSNMHSNSCYNANQAQNRVVAAVAAPVIINDFNPIRPRSVSPMSNLTNSMVSNQLSPVNYQKPRIMCGRENRSTSSNSNVNPADFSQNKGVPIPSPSKSSNSKINFTFQNQNHQLKGQSSLLVQPSNYLSFFSNFRDSHQNQQSIVESNTIQSFSNLQNKIEFQEDQMIEQKLQCNPPKYYIKDTENPLKGIIQNQNNNNMAGQLATSNCNSFIGRENFYLRGNSSSIISKFEQASLTETHHTSKISEFNQTTNVEHRATDYASVSSFNNCSMAKNVQNLQNSPRLTSNDNQSGNQIQRVRNINSVFQYPSLKIEACIGGVGLSQAQQQFNEVTPQNKLYRNQSTNNFDLSSKHIHHSTTTKYGGIINLNPESFDHNYRQDSHSPHRTQIPRTQSPNTVSDTRLVSRSPISISTFQLSSVKQPIFVVDDTQIIENQIDKLKNDIQCESNNSSIEKGGSSFSSCSTSRILGGICQRDGNNISLTKTDESSILNRDTVSAVMKENMKRAHEINVNSNLSLNKNPRESEKPVFQVKINPIDVVSHGNVGIICGSATARDGVHYNPSSCSINQLTNQELQCLSDRTQEYIFAGADKGERIQFIPGKRRSITSLLNSSNDQQPTNVKSNLEEFQYNNKIISNKGFSDGISSLTANLFKKKSEQATGLVGAMQGFSSDSMKHCHKFETSENVNTNAIPKRHTNYVCTQFENFSNDQPRNFSQNQLVSKEKPVYEEEVKRRLDFELQESSSVYQNQMAKVMSQKNLGEVSYQTDLVPNQSIPSQLFRNQSEKIIEYSNSNLRSASPSPVLPISHQQITASPSIVSQKINQPIAFTSQFQVKNYLDKEHYFNAKHDAPNDDFFDYEPITMPRDETSKPSDLPVFYSDYQHTFQPYATLSLHEIVPTALKPEIELTQRSNSNSNKITEMNGWSQIHMVMNSHEYSSFENQLAFINFPSQSFTSQNNNSTQRGLNSNEYNQMQPKQESSMFPTMKSTQLLNEVNYISGQTETQILKPSQNQIFDENFHQNLINYQLRLKTTEELSFQNMGQKTLENEAEEIRQDKNQFRQFIGTQQKLGPISQRSDEQQVSFRNYIEDMEIQELQSKYKVNQFENRNFINSQFNQPELIDETESISIGQPCQQLPLYSNETQQQKIQHQIDEKQRFNQGVLTEIPEFIDELEETILQMDDRLSPYNEHKLLKNQHNNEHQSSVHGKQKEQLNQHNINAQNQQFQMKSENNQDISPFLQSTVGSDLNSESENQSVMTKELNFSHRNINIDMGKTQKYPSASVIGSNGKNHALLVDISNSPKTYDCSQGKLFPVIRENNLDNSQLTYHLVNHFTSQCAKSPQITEHLQESIDERKKKSNQNNSISRVGEQSMRQITSLKSNSSISYSNEISESEQGMYVEHKESIMNDNHSQNSQCEKCQQKDQSLMRKNESGDLEKLSHHSNGMKDQEKKESSNNVICYNKGGLKLMLVSRSAKPVANSTLTKNNSTANLSTLKKKQQDLEESLSAQKSLQKSRNTSSSQNLINNSSASFKGVTGNSSSNANNQQQSFSNSTHKKAFESSRLTKSSSSCNLKNTLSKFSENQESSATQNFQENFNKISSTNFSVSSKSRPDSEVESTQHQENFQHSSQDFCSQNQMMSMESIDKEIQQIVINQVGRNTLSPRTMNILGKTIKSIFIQIENKNHSE